MLKRIIFFLYFNIFLLSSFAQSQLIFKHLTLKDGLPDDGIEWIIQDRLGFIWIATRVGIVKYDGYKFTQYKSGDESSGRLGQDRIIVLFEDSRGDIWGGAQGYLNRYIRSKDTLIVYKADANDPTALKGEMVFSIIEDSEGRMWFGNYRGWVNYVLKSELEDENYEIKFNHLREEEHEETYIVHNLYEDSDNTIWASTRNGLMKIKDFKIEVIQPIPGKKYDRNNTFFEIIEDEKNKYWIGTYGKGLAYYDDLKNTFTFYPIEQAKFARYSPNNILSLLTDRKDNLWCGTQGGGILRFDRDLKEYTVFRHNREIPTSLLGGYFHNLFEDNSGTIWIPAFQTGISRIDRSLNQIELYTYQIENKLNLGSEIIYCFFETSDGNIWTGTSNGIKKYNRIERKFEDVKVLRESSCNERIRALDIVEDSNGNLWMHGGHYFKVWEFNPSNNRIYCYGTGSEGKGLSNPMVSGIEADNDGYVWISTYGGGLNRININTKEFKRYFVGGPGNKRDAPEEINKMAQDTSGNIWVASYNRTLNMFDQENEKFFGKSFSDFGGGFNATGMLVDSKNRLWLATRQGGVILYDLNSKESKKFTKNDGLPSNDRIRNFFEDKLGNIYSNNENKLIEFNKNGEFEKYYEFDLGSSTIIAADYVKATNEIFLSTEKQLLRFEPGNILSNTTPPKMVITDFQYYDKSFDSTFSPNQPIDISETVELEHYQNDINLEFAALHYTNPEENQYRYILENNDSKWHESGYQRTAKYTNLSHGEYKFKVLGSNSDGVWADIPATLNIIVRPPWWLTWWAYLIYAFVFISILLTTWLMQLRRIRIKNELKMKEFETEKLKEVDQMKSNFFANISHEFRTPLTLIKGPIERLLYEEKKEDKKEVFKMILRNTKKLLNLINELLDLSKLEAGKMKLCVGKYDIISFTKGIVMSFKSLAESKEIKLTVKSDENFVEVYYDKEKMQKIISNLISNALKFTPERGSIFVNMKKELNKDVYVIEVEDSGIGVPKKELHKLFDRFYQVVRNGSDGTSGTGIGLALTKELVKMHKGSINVKSDLDKGSTFIIEIPLGKDHFTENDILIDQEQIVKFEWTDHIYIDDKHYNQEDKPLILVVEDNDDVLKYILDTLKPNYQVICTKNGEKGYEKASENIPDLIVSDIMMPVMDGNEMCKLIRKDEKTSHIPLIMLTAKAEESDKIEGLETGADDYIIKPFDPIELIVRIKNLILQRRKLREKYLKEAEIHPSEVAVTSTDKIFIEKTINIIESKLDDPSLSIEELANEIGMSRSQLYRKFSALLGEKPNDFIRKYRLKRGADLIKQDFGNIAQIAFEVGFNDPGYFSKCFKELYGVSPHDYERKHQIESR